MKALRSCLTSNTSSALLHLGLLQAALPFLHSHVDQISVPSPGQQAGPKGEAKAAEAAQTQAEQGRAEQGDRGHEEQAPARITQAERREGGQNTGGTKRIFIHTQARKLKKKKVCLRLLISKKPQKRLNYKANTDILI